MPQAFKAQDSRALQEPSMTAHRAACSSLLQITYLQVGLTLCSMVQHLPPSH